jgi:hypothetical protein
MLGSDRSSWKSNIHGVSQLTYLSFFDGIDLIYNGKNEQLSFQFQAKPHADLSQLSFFLEGADQVEIDRLGNLVITHSLGEITYSAPKAWNVSENGNRKAMTHPKHYSSILV